MRGILWLYKQAYNSFSTTLLQTDWRVKVGGFKVTHECPDIELGPTNQTRSILSDRTKVLIRWYCVQWSSEIP